MVDEVVKLFFILMTVGLLSPACISVSLLPFFADLYIYPIPSQKWGNTVTLFLNFTSGSNLTAVCYNSIDGTGDECGDFVFNEVGTAVGMLATKEL